MKTLLAKTNNDEGLAQNVVPLDKYRWKLYCGGMYKLPTAA
jgi:hypothetical protein